MAKNGNNNFWSVCGKSHRPRKLSLSGLECFDPVSGPILFSTQLTFQEYNFKFSRVAQRMFLMVTLQRKTKSAFIPVVWFTTSRKVNNS